MAAAVTKSRRGIYELPAILVVRQAPIYGFCRLLEGDCNVADARQGTTLAAPGALHSPPINSADRFATRKWKPDGLLVSIPGSRFAMNVHYQLGEFGECH
jgi:hypothetical protein